MNARMWVAFLALAGTSGCIIVSNPAEPGDVTFNWTFDGRTCSQLPGVKSVQIQISGETLENNGVFSCLSPSGSPTVTFRNFKGKTYSYTIDALGFANEKLYTKSSSFRVDGNVTVNVDLAPITTGKLSYAYLNWSFPAMAGPSGPINNPDCTTAGVANVLVSIDGSPELTIPCSLGWNTNPGYQTDFLSAGQHTISLRAVNASGYMFYGASSTLTTEQGNPAFASYALPWAVGGTSLSWSFIDTSVTQTCAQAGVTDVFINFVDSNGDLVYGTQGDKKPCSSGGVEYPFLKPGSYDVRIDAAGSLGRIFRSNYAQPPRVTIVAGQFVPMSAAVGVVLFKQ